MNQWTAESAESFAAKLKEKAKLDAAQGKRERRQREASYPGCACGNIARMGELCCGACMDKAQRQQDEIDRQNCALEYVQALTLQEHIERIEAVLIAEGKL